MPKALITSGPTIEEIDPVRYISNYSSGKQGFAIAKELCENGYDVDYISSIDPFEKIENLNHIKVKTADEMLKASISCLPAKVAIFAAAVCDWKPVKISKTKIKKTADTDTLCLELVKNPDILKTISNHCQRPDIVIGFAAESDNLVENAKLKLKSKNCDYIIANDISNDVFGSDNNQICIISENNVVSIEKQSKFDIAKKVIRLLKLI